MARLKVFLILKNLGSKSVIPAKERHPGLDPGRNPGFRTLLQMNFGLKVCKRKSENGVRLRRAYGGQVMTDGEVDSGPKHAGMTMQGEWQ